MAGDCYLHNHAPKNNFPTLRDLPEVEKNVKPHKTTAVHEKKHLVPYLRNAIGLLDPHLFATCPKVFLGEGGEKGTLSSEQNKTHQ